MSTYQGCAPTDSALLSSTIQSPIDITLPQLTNLSRLHGEDTLLSLNLTASLDAQLLMGSDIAFTPTGVIEAGDTDTLKAATAQVAELDRKDTVFILPVDPSLLGIPYIDQVEAILQQAGHPIGIVLCQQLDPLEYTTRALIRNMRRLCRTVPYLGFFRTDLNALDMIAHGALACSIGTSGSTRHMVPASERVRFRVPGDSPSLLFPDLSSWQRGDTIAKRFGRRTAPRCYCAVCDGRTLASYLDRTDHGDARAHSVLTWQRWLVAIQRQPNLGDRATYWKAQCKNAIANHAILAAQLKQRRPFAPQVSLAAWASLDAWESMASI